MNVVVILEGRFVTRNGRPSSHHLTYDRMWKRYLDVFDQVTVVARLFPIEDLDSVPVEGPGVRFFSLPAYTGPSEFLWRWRELQQRVEIASSGQCAYILRVPGNIGGLFWRRLRATGRPYAVEVVGDPYDVFAPGSVRHLLRPLFRRWFQRQLRLQCREALGAAYVTEAALQRRYPCPGHMASYSSVELTAEAFRGAGRPLRQGYRGGSLVFVGDVNQLYKGPHVLIDAVAACVREGWDLSLTFVGKGSYLPWLRSRASERGIADRVEFTGRLPAGAAVRDILDRSDLFVLPSYQEGLPRAMIEAMARGLPCIGSLVGGVGELLPDDALVPPGNARRLAEAIMRVLSDPVRMSQMSARNLERSEHYRSALLQERRIAFYRLVRARTAEQAWPRGADIGSGVRTTIG